MKTYYLFQAGSAPSCRPSPTIQQATSYPSRTDPGPWCVSSRPKRIGSHEHTIPWDKLRYDTRLGGCRTDITEEQLRGAPSVFVDREVWPDRPREQELHKYWRTPPYWGGL
jgi:hypothetical protein